ncbi:MogA/MoaB family molybdenum cofactor biosynthesis protein [Natronorarus salvus]|uniref:MogA/MoaB family molybdenum cofactor biosynthesis protein n=1 Tax=Natronorarus salvus TaxID=3117733 RepID=UPI002F26B0C4
MANEHGHGHGEHEEHHDHDHHDHDLDGVSVAIYTISSSRDLDEDTAGDAIESILGESGIETAERAVVPDDAAAIAETVEGAVRAPETDAVVTTGGTGVTPDDVTIEAIEALFEKELPGFGELFRTLSYEEVGTRVVATRATAGIVGSTPVFCLPGSENAARLGAEELIAPEVAHLAGLAGRD